jgi:GTPase SAR1 family protein
MAALTMNRPNDNNECSVTHRSEPHSSNAPAGKGKSGSRAGTPNQEHFADLLKGALEIIDPLKAVLPSWYARIEKFLAECSASRLRIGVIGITSSGKSAFINQLGGESLLPEESQATTNVPVICRYGPERKVRVVYDKDLQVETFVGTDVTPGLVKSFCAESENSNNFRGVRRVEVELPTFRVNPSMELIDTPGTDAFGHENHAAITIQQCIPIADVVVFMVRGNKGGLHEADAKLLAHVLEGDQRVIFVIACSDLILENTERGEVTTSREQKLENTVKALRTSLAEFPALDSSPVIAISSKWARDANGDQDSGIWRDSNFDAVLGAFDACASDLDTLILEERKLRTRAYIRTLAKQVPSQADALKRQARTTAEDKQYVSDMDAKIRQLRAAKTAIARRLSDLEATTASLLDTRTLLAVPLEAISCDAQSLYNARDRADERWRTVTNQITEALTAVRIMAREQLNKLALKPTRKVLQDQMLKVETLPSASRYIKSEVVTYYVEEPRDWPLGVGRLFDWAFGVPKKARSRTETSVDTYAFREVLKEYFADSCRTWLKFVTEQISILATVYIGPIDDRLVEHNQSLHDFKTIRELAAGQLTLLPHIVERLEALLAADEPARSQNIWNGVTSTSGAPSPSTPVSIPVRTSNRAMRTLLGTVWEAAAARSFWRVANLTAGTRPIQGLLLVGRTRATLEAVARFLRSTAPPTGTLGAAWTADRPIDISALDDSSPLDDFFVKCKRASIVVVEFDAAQPSSGLSSLHRDERLSTLVDHVDKLMLASWEGAAFDHRLADLPEQVAPMIARDSGFGARPWYVIEFDRRDARYTDLLEIYDEVARSSAGNRGLIARWTARRLSTSAPFTLEHLKSIAVTDMNKGASV